MSKKEAHKHIPRNCIYGLDDECQICPNKEAVDVSPVKEPIEGLREEFIKLFDNPLRINENPPSAYQIADWWLEKLSQTRKDTQREIGENFIKIYKDSSNIESCISDLLAYADHLINETK